MPPVKNIVRNQWCTESRTWPGSEDERAQFEVKKRELLDAAVRCVQYVLVSLAREVEENKRESLFVAPRVLRGLSDSRIRELVSFLYMDGAVLRNDESAGTALLARDAVDVFDRWCHKDAKVVAQNWEKGYRYKVCVQHKPTSANDETHVLNSVESIVAVLLHEIAHTVHGDHEAHAKHSSEFEEINTFLVQYAQCAMGRASEQEQRRWRGVRANWRDAVQRGRIRFDIAAFREMCSSQTPVLFCGMRIPVGKCHGTCKGGA